MSQDVEDRPNKGMPWPELIVAILVVGTLAAVLLPAYQRARSKESRRPSCQNNLKQFALAFKMYANESKGELYPPMQRPIYSESPRLQLSPDMSAIYPEYLTDPAILVCPTSATMSTDDLKNKNGDYAVNRARDAGGALERTDDCYVYWGWAMDKINAGSYHESLPSPYAEFAGIPPNTTVPVQVRGAIQTSYDAWVKRIDLPEFFELETRGKEVLGNGGSNTIYRLREGVERFMITDINNPAATAKAQSDLVLMHDVLYPDSAGDPGPYYSNHVPPGMNVLFLDGHMEFFSAENEKLPNTFPDTYLSSLSGALTN